MDGHKNITCFYSDHSNKTFSINEFTNLQYWVQGSEWRAQVTDNCSGKQKNFTSVRRPHGLTKPRTKAKSQQHLPGFCPHPSGDPVQPPPQPHTSAPHTISLWIYFSSLSMQNLTINPWQTPTAIQHVPSSLHSFFSFTYTCSNHLTPNLLLTWQVTKKLL